MVFMLPMEFLAPCSDDQEIDFPGQIAELALDPMTAMFEKPSNDERQHLKAQRGEKRKARPLFLRSFFPHYYGQSNNGVVKGKVDGQPMTKILIDGGAAINIMPYAVY